MALLWESMWVACFSDLPPAGAGMVSSGLIGFLGERGCWVLGRGVCFVGVCFGFGNELFGAAYHLRDECHTFNIFGVTVRSE